MGTVRENMATGTELPHDFWAGVVLVLQIYYANKIGGFKRVSLLPEYEKEECNPII